MKEETSFYYDEEFQCLVKVVSSEKETRMSLDKDDLLLLQCFLRDYCNFKINKRLVDLCKTTEY